MRTYLKKLAHELPSRSVVLSTVILFIATIIPVAVFAWGPSRPTFTTEVPATYVTFNSITNNPVQGDERNFMQVRAQDADNSTYADSINLTPGKQYVVYIYYHNNAASNYNASGVGIAHNAYARAEVPAIVGSGKSEPAQAFVGASNANPTNVYDDITFKNTTGGDIALRYVPGSTTIHNQGPTNGATMPDTILGSNGVKLGYDSLNGTLPGCNQYAGFITFRVEADQPNFTFKKDVRVSGTKEWKDAVSAAPGTKVDYLLTYDNTGSTVQNNVVLKDQLPQGLTYVAGSSKLTTVNDPKGKAVDDGINSTGLNIGNYDPDSNAFLVFSATVNNDATPCATLTNTAAVETDNGSRKDTATVTVGGNCVAALPTTGPAEVIISLMGVAAITFGIVYYLKSRRDLDDALLNAQSHPTFHTIETDVEAQKAHEHKQE